MKKKLNFVFLGTPNLATYVLDELMKADYLPSLIVTAPDMKVGREINLMLHQSEMGQHSPHSDASARENRRIILNFYAKKNMMFLF